MNRDAATEASSRAKSISGLIARLGCWLLLISGTSLGGDALPSPAQRGEEALFHHCYSPGIITRDHYERLWTLWDVSEKPADYAAAVRKRYGLHSAPYANDGLPMGLRLLAPGSKEIGIDCMLCHGGTLLGEPLVGLPNTSLDLTGLFEDFAAIRGLPKLRPYRLSNVLGTTEATATAMFLIAFRDPELNLRPPANLGRIPDTLCEDPPAWWLLHRKQTMYHNGQLDARSVRPLMAFMMSPLTRPETFRNYEASFLEIREYLLTLEPPRYPGPLDSTLVQFGKVLFEQHCQHCHGEGGRDGDYPNTIVPLAEIGTDPSLVTGLTPQMEEHYRKSWFGRSPGPDGRPLPIAYNQGYQAPPLDGVWATAPYFHNGSAPTLWHVLNSATRPRVFTRSFESTREDFDAQRIGWKVTELEQVPDGLSETERRRYYDTDQPGRSRAGHTFGDELSDDERWAIIEYLKSL